MIIKSQSEWNVLSEEQKKSGNIEVYAGYLEISGNASITAYDNASVRASGNANITAFGNASVRAYDNASITAYDNASVRAYDNASITAYDNASITAYDNASVRAYDNASVRAYDNASVRAYDNASVKLYCYSTCHKMSKKTQILSYGESRIIEPIYNGDVNEWLNLYNIKINKGKVILFKRVSKDFLTQENTPNETRWKTGFSNEHHDWKPRESECGSGKFHAVAVPFMADQFRQEKGDKYIAIEIAIKDLYAWPNPIYPNKIAFRKGKVLYECDADGNKIKETI